MTRVLFRVAAGPSTGFGHLVRCRSIARALGVIPTTSIRGTRETRATAAALGFDVRHGGVALLRGLSRPDVLVIDDPSAEHAARWVRSARKAGVPVATLHDAGLAYTASDLAIDGSIAPRLDDPLLDLAGPVYAALDPSIAATRAASPRPRTGVLVALGGGEHVQRWGLALSLAVLERHPQTSVRVAAGFTHMPQATADSRVVWVRAPHGLADELRRAEVAVVGGGVTLYEAAALSAPVVAVAAVAEQQRTIHGFARRHAAVDGGLLETASAPAIADQIIRLLTNPPEARRLGQAGSRIVDGRGVFRVAEAVRRLARRSGRGSHAA